MIAPIDLGIPGLTNIERIGVGGNAVVFRARQADLDRDVVVKVLTAVDAATTRRRFDRERRAMGRLSQAAGIAPLYGSGFTPNGQPYLLMPFYENGSLQNALDESGALPPERVRDIGVAICRAVQTAHDNGVLHRDLKPANLLLRRSGEADVADFGIAHLTDDSLGTSTALTMTPLYTAPEVFDGIDSGRVSDVYSLGATLFAALNGHPAYGDPDGTTPVLSLMRRINEEPVPELPATTPVELAAAIRRAMSKDPNDRQQSAAEFADELAAASLIPPRVRRGASRRRSPALLVAVMAVLIAAIGGAVAAAMLIDRSQATVGPDVSPTATATSTPRPTETPSPTSEPDEPTPAAIVFDLDAAAATAAQALVRVEAFSCGGVDIATGVVVGDDIVVTDDSVLTSPWYIDVVAGGDTFGATLQSENLEKGFAFLLVDDPTAFEVLMGIEVRAGDPVAIVGIDGEPALAQLTIDDAAIDEESDVLLAEVVNPGEGNAIEPVDAVVTDSGGLAGIASVSPGRIEVVTPLQLDNEAASPNYDCAPRARDLGSSDAESVVSPAIAELLTLQRLNDAYADENWDLVRQLEPARVDATDASLVEGWRGLRRGFIYPVGREVSGDEVRWRIGLIGHETWLGADLTTLFCVTWAIDPVLGTITQTNDDTVLLYGSQPGQPQQPGFVDPADLRSRINDRCPL